MLSRFEDTFETAWDIKFPIVDFTLLKAFETFVPTADNFSLNFDRISSNFPPVKLFIKEYPAV